MGWFRRMLGMENDDVPLYGPQGVTLTYSDGVTFNDVPSIYIGHDPGDKCAVYEIIAPRDPNQDRPINMTIDVFPPMTAVVFPFDGKPKLGDDWDAGLREADPGETYD